MGIEGARHGRHEQPQEPTKEPPASQDPGEDTGWHKLIHWLPRDFKPDPKLAELLGPPSFAGQRAELRRRRAQVQEQTAGETSKSEFRDHPWDGPITKRIKAYRRGEISWHDLYHELTHWHYQTPERYGPNRPEFPDEIWFDDHTRLTATPALGTRWKQQRPSPVDPCLPQGSTARSWRRS